MQNQNPGHYAHTTDADERPLTGIHAEAHKAGLCKCVQFGAVASGSCGGSQPSPYPASLPSVAPDGSPTGNAAAFDELEAWVAKSPAARTVWCIDRLNGKWRVGLASDGERLTAGEARTLAQAVRNALTISEMAGLL